MKWFFGRLGGVWLLVTKSVQRIDAACLAGGEESGHQSDDGSKGDDEGYEPGGNREEVNFSAAESSGDEIQEEV